jgi:hypothetical protein
MGPVVLPLLVTAASILRSFSPLSLLTLGMMRTGFSHATKSRSSAQLECSE